MCIHYATCAIIFRDEANTTAERDCAKAKQSSSNPEKVECLNSDLDNWAGALFQCRILADPAGDGDSLKACF